MQASIRWLIDWMRLDTALEILDPPLSPSLLILPLSPSLAIARTPREGRELEGHGGRAFPKAVPCISKACAGARLHPQSHAGKVWERPGVHAHRGRLAPGTGIKRICNVKPPLAHEISDGDTALEHGVGLWPSQTDGMNKPAGRGVFPRL